MGFKLIVDRLTKAELIYLIKVRSSTTPTDGKATKLRTTLRTLLTDETNGKTSDAGNYPFTFVEDFEAVAQTKDELTGLIEEYKITHDKNRAQAIETKFTYGLERITRSVPTNDDEVAKKETLFTTLSVMRSRYEITTKQPYTLSPPIDPADVTTSTITTTTTVTSTISVPSVSQASFSGIKPVPVAKWNLHFSGDLKTLSLSAFLERVTELSRARNVTREQLFDEACDLFSGKALVWYRANVALAKNWKELEELLRLEFQPINYDERLLDEIKRRTQGHDESMGMYVAVMKNMFARLSQPHPEDQQLRIILRNMSPFYQTQLGLVDVNTIHDLLVYGRKIEERRYAVENFVPPSKKKGDLEVDLAYVNTAVAELDVSTISPLRDTTTPVTSQLRTAAPPNVSSPTFACWNCGDLSHRAGRCPKPRTKVYCFRCGKPDVTVKSCAKCGNERVPSGNAPRRH